MLDWTGLVCLVNGNQELICLFSIHVTDWNCHEIEGWKTLFLGDWNLFSYWTLGFYFLNFFSWKESLTIKGHCFRVWILFKNSIHKDTNLTGKWYFYCSSQCFILIIESFQCPFPQWFINGQLYALLMIIIFIYYGFSL